MGSEGNTSSKGGQPGAGPHAPSPFPFLHYITTFPASHATRNDLVTQVLVGLRTEESCWCPDKGDP